MSSNHQQSFYRRLFSLVLPMAAQNLLNALVSASDALMLGFLDQSSLSAVSLATVGHPLRPDMREYMYTDPVTICDNVWIGENVTICPGVTIGENSVIGAGSVVVKDIPANVVAVGNPCRVLREIGEKDMEYYYRNRRIDPEDLKEEAELRKK